VQLTHTIRNAARAAAAFVAAAFVVSSLGTALAVTTPHVPDGDASTSSCAMCHRAHTATTAVAFRGVETTETTGTSLLLTTDPTRGDVALCLVCHGIGQFGSNSDVETAFTKSSVHSLAPIAAPYGTKPIGSPMICSTCHDPHGVDRRVGGTTWPALLRAYSADATTPVFTGEGYCAACHTGAEPGERWAGLAVYMRTGHFSGIPTPTTGTQIRCSICHDPHGSNVAPLLIGSLVPASVVSTFTVTRDDRTFCVACHPGPAASWPASNTYAASGHGSSPVTVPISAHWVPGTGRRVGECQVCHAPMGRPDGSGGTIPKLLDAKGRVLCETCHVTGGVAASRETSSQSRPIAGAPTLAAVYAPSNGTTKGRVSLYGTSTVGAGRLSGPRQYWPSAGTGPSAVGDIDNDGRPELVVASGTTLTVYDQDSLTGLELVPATYGPLPAAVVKIAIGNIVVNTLPSGDYPEIAVIDTAGHLYLYIVPTSLPLATVAGPIDVGTGPWGLAIGGLQLAGTTAIVTDANGGADGRVLAFYADGLGGVTQNEFATGGSPVAPAIGELWDTSLGNEIVVCDSVSTTENVRVYSSGGVLLAGYLVASGDGVPRATAIGDVLWGAPDGTGKAELAVALANASGDSTVVVVPQYLGSPGLSREESTPVRTGIGYNTGSLLIGDVDGDTHAELVAGNGGTWSGSAWVAPSVWVWRADAATGQSLLAADVYVGGGTELAGAAPSLGLGAFGPVFPSRHPSDEATVTHVSTETASFDRHVTCSDCHNTHESTVTAAPAPLVTGPLAGAWGVAVSYPGPAFAGSARADNGYEICFKCHSSSTALAGRPDAAAQFDPANASLHSVEGASGSDVPAATFVAPVLPGDPTWTAATILQCTDCHGDSGKTGAQARELHESPSAPILNTPYLGTNPASGAVLCYVCHRYTVYAEGSADALVGMSFFQEAAPDRRLHAYHVAGVGGHGLSCSACHVAHGSTTNAHLLRSDIGFDPDLVLPHAGRCDNTCHAGSHVWPSGG
jgi:predicted CXXCH cytochrome family protein